MSVETKEKNILARMLKSSIHFPRCFRQSRIVVSKVQTHEVLPCAAAELACIR